MYYAARWAIGSREGKGGTGRDDPNGKLETDSGLLLDADEWQAAFELASHHGMLVPAGRA